MPLTSTSPLDGTIFATYDELAPEATMRRVELAHEAFLGWRRTSFATRRGVLERCADLLEARSEELGTLMAREMGKPLREGVAESKKCAWVCRHYAEHGETYLADEHVATEARESFVAYRPLGVTLAVMPWNFPLWQVFRFAAPTLMAGNAALLKHASNVPGSALVIEELLRDSGLPDHVFQTLLVGSGPVEALVASPLVRSVSLTGSTPAGSAVARAAGRHLTPSVLELGGSDPYLILEDADLDLAVGTCVRSRTLNSGQSCIAAKRFIVVEAVREAFTERFTATMAALVYGDPLDEASDLGPLARHDLRDELHEQVTRSIEAGARCLTGGFVPEGPGAFYPPTVLADVRPGMAAFDEELFGPVAAIIPARDEAEAIALANRSVFGLGAAVFTRDVARGRRIARDELEAGAAFVNDFVKSDPRLPFGGIKASGYGRELARHGILALVNTKTVYVGDA